MERKKIKPRFNWQKIVEGQGLYYHSLPSEQPEGTPAAWKTEGERIYWNESVYYHFESREVDEIEECTYWLNQYCLQAVDYIIDNNMFEKANWEPLKKIVHEKTENITPPPKNEQ